MSKENYDRFKKIVWVIIIVSIFIIGFNLVNRSSNKNFNLYFSENDISFSDEETVSYETILVNLNTAGFDELVEIPGVGEKIANKIITYRFDAGGFEDVEELKFIDGISNSLYNNILPYVLVEK